VTADIDVLPATFRPDHSHHTVAILWLAEARAACEAGQATLRVLPMVPAGFLRLVSNAKVLDQPHSIEDAFDFAQALPASPGPELASCAELWPLLR
jgi:hypothetical protein